MKSRAIKNFIADLYPFFSAFLCFSSGNAILAALSNTQGLEPMIVLPADIKTRSLKEKNHPIK